MNARLHRKTPTISVIDSRGLPVRQVAYCRRNADDKSQARMTHQHYDTAGRQVTQWDPRLFATAPDANLTTVYSLSGKALLVNSVDSGWRLSLPGDAGQVLRSWDQRENHWRTTYDNQLRPTAIHEQVAGQDLRSIECLRYGDNSPESAARNVCGALIRHDDSAGTLLIEKYALCAKPLSQTRHFLSDTEQPDWPLDDINRDALLEEGDGYETSWQYDALGAVVLQTDAAQHQQRYSFDVAGQLKSVSLKVKDATTEKNIVKDLVYSAFGQVESQTAGNGVISRAVFNPASGRLSALSASVSASVLQELHYTYDAVGNVTRIEDKAQPVRFGSNQRVDAISTFTYDSLYQLTRATGREAAGQNIQPQLPPSTRTPIDANQLFNFIEYYAYDSSGNLTELRHVRDGNNYTRTQNIDPGSNRLKSWNKGNSMPDVTAHFDASGNQQALSPGQALKWNARNQLSSVVLVKRTEGPADSEVYCYDSGGQRVRKIQTTHAASNSHIKENRYLPGLEIHTRQNERLEVITLQAGRCNVRYLLWTQGRPTGIAKNQLRYSLDDHLGSSSLELDDQAWLISQESYLPYGGTAWSASRSEVEASYRTIRYSGKERDASGLYYYGHRYYAPWLQRWISADPAGPVDGLNLYCMVGNNPVRFFDHQGLVKINTSGFITPWAAQDFTAIKILNTVNANAGEASKKRKKPKAEALEKDPDLGLSKNTLKDFTAHTYGNFYDEQAAEGVALERFYNLKGPKSGPTGFGGVDNDYKGTATSAHYYLNFGSYKIGNTPDYMADLASRYSATKDDPHHRVKLTLDLLEKHPTISRTAGSAHELQQWTRDSIEQHIDRSHGIIPIRAGGPGAHAEVRALNTIVALYPGQAERVLSETTLCTTKLTGEGVLEPFVACINCSGIIPKTVDVWTHRTPMNYARYNAHIRQINGAGD